MKWIPMSERLPENGHYYLWCSDMGSVQSDYYWDGFEKEQKYGYNIVAWMPLPRPYTADRKTDNSSEIPNNCEDLQDWKDRMWAEAIVTEPTISKMEQVEDEPQLTAKCLNCSNGGSYKCTKCDGEMYYKYDKDEPQTGRSE